MQSADVFDVQHLAQNTVARAELVHDSERDLIRRIWERLRSRLIKAHVGPF